MTKYTIEIEEQRTYRTTVTFESDLPKDKVAEILNKIKETNNCVDTDDLVDKIIDEGKFYLTRYKEDAAGELDELEIIDCESEE